MLSYSEIRSMIDQRGFRLKAFCEKIGITPQGLEPAIVKETLPVRVLKKMSEALNVPVSFFFNETEGVSALSTDAKGRKLCLGCADKSEIISLQRDKIAYMERENSNLQDDLAEAKKENARLQLLVASGAAKPADAA